MEPAPPESPADETLHRLQQAAFGYFLSHTNEDNGLVRDSSREGAPCSIAVVGFALSCYPVGVERGWIGRRAAAARVQKALRFFMDSAQSDHADSVTGYRGFYYHFLDMQTGERVWNCELSVIDTTLFVAGALTAAHYFSGADPVEAEIRSLADKIHRRIDFAWALDHETGAFVQGWRPEGGFIHYDWNGYSEAIILYVLAAAGLSREDAGRAYHAWTSCYQWENIYGSDVLYAGPLFIHLFSHAWIDFRGIADAFMAARGTDYFRNTTRTVGLQQTYCHLNPGEFAGYHEHSWGLTACDGPSGRLAMRSGASRDFYGYAARGAPFGPDDGTLAPWAPLACLPFAEEAALRCLTGRLRDFPEVLEQDRFRGSFNPSLPGDGAAGWVSPDCFGLDQGLVVMMIENHRSGLIWKLTRGAAVFRDGLRALGFGGGWLA
ncbi:hypothetical protein GI374_05630 [Paracoccus sp. S-4012]|uniref:glucoamylase family protein n=1 Tax=Paracoccus sp. S-4012 TaxID=2665648 RepID=UPI0012B12342|nr:glucoamylase family protein [Paracoccus sp. S-4012]MRX49937.1 hypothetical protein [Paracoccus sp. S-4012]